MTKHNDNVTVKRVFIKSLNHTISCIVLQTVSGRRIRIEVSTHDNDRRMGRSGMGRSDRDR